MACPQLVPGPDENLQPLGENLRGSLLAVRFWNHDSSRGKLEVLTWETDPTIADLCREVVRANGGSLLESSAFLLARFADPLRALSIAKALQEALLPRSDSLEKQFIAAVAIHGELESASATSQTDRSLQMLNAVSPAHILVSEEVFDVAKTAAGFVFETDATLATNDNGDSTKLYELYWTDKATYRTLATMLQSSPVTLRRSARYEILTELGRGGMGVVYKAHDRVIDRVVALKTIAVVAEEAQRASLMRRLQQEAKAAGHLDHPNIVTIYDIGADDGNLYLSMQFVEGETLSTVLARKKRLPLQTLLSYVDQICSAVGFAHDHGIIHRDLKPSNVMINAQGTVKVLDFGIAKLGEAGTTEAGALLGTPDYMSPEQAAGRRTDHRSDIFSLGAMFYELFTNEKAFSAQSVAAVLFKVVTDDPVPPSVLEPGLPRRIGAAIQKALAKSPEDRFQGCEEMRASFRQAATTEPEALKPGALAAVPMASAKPEPVEVEKPVAGSRSGFSVDAIAVRFLRRNPGQLAMSLGAAFLLTLTAVVMLTLWAKPRHADPRADSAPISAVPANPSLAIHMPVAATPQEHMLPRHDSPAVPAKPRREKPSARESGNIKNGGLGTASTPPSPPAVPAPERVNGFGVADIPDIMNRAEKLYGEGHYRDAIAAYENVLKLEPGNESARSALSKARMVLEDRSKHR
jgi:eukaryotic-like serine/threonine-protein kinase